MVMFGSILKLLIYPKVWDACYRHMEKKKNKKKFTVADTTPVFWIGGTIVSIILLLLF